MSAKFDSQLQNLKIELTETQKQQFDKYYELLVEWNKVMNLTGITEYEEVNEKPLKIAFPHLKVVLLDSLNKRIKFLNAVIEELGLENVETLHGRAEDYARKEEYREQFDLCVSRAVANLSTLSEYCLPYVKKGGMFVPYKSGNIDEELKQSEKAIQILGGKLTDTVKFELPGTEIGRSFVKIKKVKNTGKKFPRKAGLPSKEPIC